MGTATVGVSGTSSLNYLSADSERPQWQSADRVLLSLTVQGTAIDELCTDGVRPVSESGVCPGAA
jgi:hypothetical protein